MHAQGIVQTRKEEPDCLFISVRKTQIRKKKNKNVLNVSLILEKKINFAKCFVAKHSSIMVAGNNNSERKHRCFTQIKDCEMELQYL